MSTFYRTGNVCVSKMKFPIDVKYIADAPSGKGKKKKEISFPRNTFQNQAQ